MPQDLEKIVLGVAIDRAYSEILVISEMYKRGRYMVDEDICSGRLRKKAIIRNLFNLTCKLQNRFKETAFVSKLKKRMALGKRRKAYEANPALGWSVFLLHTEVTYGKQRR